MTTTNLGLNTFTPGTSLDQSFEDYRINLDGPTLSNMTMIDSWAGGIATLLPLILSDTSASMAIATTFITNATGSAIASASQVHSIETFFIKLGEFSGSGQADFNGFSQSFTHILILGQASASAPYGRVDVGIDFNGDSGSSSYLALQWVNSGSSSPYGSGSLAYYQSSQITISTVSGSPYQNYAGSIMAIIPYYSGTGGFNKTAMGYSTLAQSPWITSSFQGGYWNSPSAITRIRVFARQPQTTSPTSKYNFFAGTKISLYGIL